MNLKALTEQKAEKQTEMESLLNTVKTEERAFSDEESELFTQLESDIQRINEVQLKVDTLMDQLEKNKTLGI